MHKLSLKKGLPVILLENIVLLFFLIFFGTNIREIIAFTSVIPLFVTSVIVAAGIALVSEKKKAYEFLKKLPLVNTFAIPGMFCLPLTFLAPLIAVLAKLIEDNENGGSVPYYLMIQITIAGITILRRNGRLEYIARSFYTSAASIFWVAPLYLALRLNAVSLYEILALSVFLGIKTISEVYINSFVLNKFEG